MNNFGSIDEIIAIFLDELKHTKYIDEEMKPLIKDHYVDGIRCEELCRRYNPRIGHKFQNFKNAGGLDIFFEQIREQLK
jgi:hypothetical protein